MMDRTARLALSYAGVYTVVVLLIISNAPGHATGACITGIVAATLMVGTCAYLTRPNH